MGYSCFELEIEDGIAHLRLSRPDQLNSMIPAFWTELPSAVAELNAREGTRVIVLSSTGRHFTSGMDLSVFKEGSQLKTDTSLDRERLRSLILNLQDSFNCLERSRVPVMAAIQGGCIGGGVDLVCACDLRYATSTAFFCIQEINIGIMADLGTLQRLPKLIPEGIVRELAYTGDRMPADRAKACGLVNEVFETQEKMLEQVMTVARKIAGRSPLAIAASKEAISYVRDHSVADALQRTADWQAAIFDRGHLLESVQASQEKREPSFPDLYPATAGL